MRLKKIASTNGARKSALLLFQTIKIFFSKIPEIFTRKVWNFENEREITFIFEILFLLFLISVVEMRPDLCLGFQ